MHLNTRCVIAFVNQAQPHTAGLFLFADDAMA